MTHEQIADRSKDVTRRLGWAFLVEKHRETMEATGRGVRLTVVHKCMGLKKGEKQRVLAEIETVDVRREPLDAIMTEPDGPAREGFPDLAPAGFVALFCKSQRCYPSTEVTRIEFRYLEAP